MANVTRRLITHLGAQGDGVAEGPVFIPGTAPGDWVDVSDDGHVVAVTSGPNRASPSCSHYGVCGGCQLQHITTAAYSDWLGSRIGQALAQHGLAAEHIAPAYVSPPRSRRRASLRAVVRNNGLAEVGFNQKQSHQLVDVRDCSVLVPALERLLPPLRSLLPSLVPRKRAVSIDLLSTATGVDIVIHDLPALGLDAREKLAAFAIAQDLARLSVDGPTGLEMIVEQRIPVMRWGSHLVPTPPGIFSQATDDGESAMQALVCTACEDAGAVADLFCGLGAFAVPLSAHHTVHAVEGARAQILALDRFARAHQLPITTDHRDLFRRPLTAVELNRFDAVVFDPPRAGARDQVAALASSKVRTIIAVSCNPNTFARDSAMLVARGYKLTNLWPIGQFVWSNHVELVALFRRL